MSDNTDRFRFDNIDKFAVSSLFVIMEGAGYERKKFVPTSEISHLERYQYTLGVEKVTLVYDTKAKMLTVDAKAPVLDGLKKLMPQSRPPVDYMPREIVIAAKPKPPQVQQAGSGNQQAKPPTQDNSAEKKPRAVKKPKKQKAKPVADVKPQVSENADKPAGETKNKPAENTSESFSLPKVAKNRFEWCVKMINELPDVKMKQSSGNGSAEGAYQISSDAGKLAMTYAKTQTVTLQGKPGKLFDDVKTILSTKSDLRVLKKYLPTGIRYLSEPSRIDLSNGINDLAGNVRLSDYSVLLIAPYRALEKLIYDLQQTEGINVKMIGQAYEKDDTGKYMLKKGYTKRIGSIVYSEVVTALYTEYFAIRNFYTHSDNSAESQSRNISNKAEAQNILKKLLGVIEYNCKKLSEIGFSLENNQ